MEAARIAFTEEGYASASLRGIARRAGVDHALVSYYFGTKAGLFQTVAALALPPARVLDLVNSAAPPERRARALLETALAAWDDPEYGRQITGLVREALAVPETRRLLEEYVQVELMSRLVASMGGDARAARGASAAASLLTGIFFTRYLLVLESVAALPRTEVVERHAPALEAILREATGGAARRGRSGTEGWTAARGPA